MRKHSLRIPFVVLVVCLATSTAQAQWPGEPNRGQQRPGFPPVPGGVGIRDGMNLPPGVVVPRFVNPAFPDQEKRRDDQDLLSRARILGHAIPHGIPSHNGPTSARAAHPPTPKVNPSELRVPPSEFRFTPASEFHYTPPRFKPVMGEGASTFGRGFSFGKGGGILAGIGGAITAALGAIFGRKKDS